MSSAPADDSPKATHASNFLRQIIERETGREVAELFLHGGHWHAVTARGPVPVSELLKSGYVRVGVK